VDDCLVICDCGWYLLGVKGYWVMTWVVIGS